MEMSWAFSLPSQEGNHMLNSQTPSPAPNMVQGKHQYPNKFKFTITKTQTGFLNTW